MLALASCCRCSVLSCGNVGLSTQSRLPLVPAGRWDWGLMYFQALPFTSQHRGFVFHLLPDCQLTFVHDSCDFNGSACPGNCIVFSAMLQRSLLLCPNFVLQVGIVVLLRACLLVCSQTSCPP